MVAGWSSTKFTAMFSVDEAIDSVHTVLLLAKHERGVLDASKLFELFFRIPLYTVPSD
jgi:hypothetical protein